MNYVLILEALFAALELGSKVAASSGMDAAELEAYIKVQNKVRQELMGRFRSDADPDPADDVTTLEEFDAR